MILLCKFQIIMYNKYFDFFFLVNKLIIWKLLRDRYKITVRRSVFSHDIYTCQLYIIIVIIIIMILETL